MNVDYIIQYLGLFITGTVVPLYASIVGLYIVWRLFRRISGV